MFGRDVTAEIAAPMRTRGKDAKPPADSRILSSFPPAAFEIAFERSALDSQQRYICELHHCSLALSSLLDSEARGAIIIG